VLHAEVTSVIALIARIARGVAHIAAIAPVTGVAGVAARIAAVVAAVAAVAAVAGRVAAITTVAGGRTFDDDVNFDADHDVSRTLSPFPLGSGAKGKALESQRLDDALLYGCCDQVGRPGYRRCPYRKNGPLERLQEGPSAFA